MRISIKYLNAVAMAAMIGPAISSGPATAAEDFPTIEAQEIDIDTDIKGGVTTSAWGLASKAETTIGFDNGGSVHTDGRIKVRTNIKGVVATTAVGAGSSASTVIGLRNR